ncbi:MAG: DUF2079 domain-containing protein [Chloroflexi bacterium]|nr:DUF2079 domain-containing protein [Chloroflexota bacterium]
MPPLAGSSPPTERSSAAAARGAARAAPWPTWPVRAAWGITVAGFLLFAWVAVRQHDTFHTRARDMGIYAQVIWNTGQGRPFVSTLLEDNRLHIAEHVAPVMALIAPLYALLPDPRLLLLLQQACLAGAGLPLFFWARRQIGDLAALGLLVGYLLMPATSRIAFSEFHPVVMAALPVALGVKATLEGRTRQAVLWLLVALLFEEETAPIVGAAGAYLWLRHRRWTGFALGALASVWLVLLTLVVMPAFHDRRTLAGVDGNRTVDHYEQVQQRPAIVLEWLGGSRGAHAAAWILLPTLGLPLLAPGTLFIALPSFALLFLPDREGNVVGHWAGAVLPVYWFAAGGGLATVPRLLGRQDAVRRRLAQRAFVGVLAVVLAVCFWRYSYFPGGGENDRDWLAWTEQEEDIARAVALAPPGVDANATRRIVPHIANRPEVYQFPSSFYSAPMRPDLRAIDAYLFDLTDTQTRRALDATDQDTVLTRSPRFAVRAWSETILLLTRDRPAPTQAADLAFGGSIRLYGYDLDQRPGRVRLIAYWESTARPAAWTRHAELVAADGKVVAEVEGAPLDPYLPPRRWDRGQLVAETVDLRPPPETPAGSYRVRLGWRDQNGRPASVNGADTVDMATVTLP